MVELSSRNAEAKGANARAFGSLGEESSSAGGPARSDRIDFTDSFRDVFRLRSSGFSSHMGREGSYEVSQTCQLRELTKLPGFFRA
jgi:hypothetical protein